jgi:serine phosphatase RsbU (regulator of sigma subunit)
MYFKGETAMNQSQYIHIAFELWSAFFCIIALICVVSARFHDKTKTKFLGLQLFTCAMLNVSDMLAYLFRGDISELGYYMVRISNFSVFLCNHLLLLFATQYICYRLGTKFSKSTIPIRRTISIICSFGIFMLILSRIFGFYYAFDDQNRYYRLVSTYWIMLAIQLVGIIILTGYTVFHWRVLRTLEKIAYLSYEVLPIVAIGFQTFIYGVSLSTLATTFSAMLMFIVYEREYSESMVAEKERIHTELSLATAIQTSLLPHVFPPFPTRKEFDIYAATDPAREVGGDFYDFFLIDEDHLCLVMADVSGKGIPAALFMMISKTILQSCAMMGHSVEEILTKTNDGLTENNQTGMFVTVWMGILEISTGKISCANAGHEYPAIMRAGGQFELFKDKHGFVLGGMEDMIYKEYEIKLNHGDRLFLYTDGVPEAADRKENMYGTDRMIKALNKDTRADVKSLCQNVRADINDFVKDAEQFDDLTMMCLEYK